MSEVKLSSLYKVTMTEYERGWGQRPMGEKFFTTEEEAKSSAKNILVVTLSVTIVQSIEKSLDFLIHL